MTAGLSLPRLREALAAGDNILTIVESARRKNPCAVAVVDAVSGTTMTYTELLESVGALGSHIATAYLGDGALVALLLAPSPRLLVASLAVMKAGAAWLPLDCRSPVARLRHLALEVAQVRLLIYAATNKVEASNLDFGVPTWALGPLGAVEAMVPLSKTLALESKSCPPGTVAVFLTSGTSGQPKAVTYGSEFLLHGVLSFEAMCELGTSSVALLKAPSHWAVIEYELFPALVAGGIIVCNSSCQQDVQLLSETVSLHTVSVLVTSDPVLRMLGASCWRTTAPSCLQHIVNVGGALSLDSCNDVMLQAANVHNMYGCTESACTTWTVKPCDVAKHALALAGLPQPGMRVHVLSDDLAPLPNGQIGEVCFAGPFLASGYLHDPTLTAMKFIDCSLGRLYRTGDLGRWISVTAEAAGLALELVGRKDRQINLNGLRIAPEEIETAILEIPWITAVTVIEGKGEARGSGMLVALVEGHGPDLENNVSLHCKDCLPEQLRPRIVHHVSSLPKLGNGKVDLAIANNIISELLFEHNGRKPVLDSLGLMQRRLGKLQPDEDVILAVARALATLHVICWHWYYLTEKARTLVYIAASPNVDWTKVSAKQLTWINWMTYTTWINGPLWWQVLVCSGFGGRSLWAMQMFSLCSGYNQRKMTDAKTRFTREEKFCLALYFALYHPLPSIFQFIYATLLQNVGPPEKIGGYYLGDEFVIHIHRWYLIFYVFCSVIGRLIFSPLATMIQRQSPAKAATCYALAMIVCVGVPFCCNLLPTSFLNKLMGESLYTATYDFNMCQQLHPQSFALRFMGWLVPGVTQNPPSCYILNYIRLFGLLCAGYSVGWWSGHQAANLAEQLLHRCVRFGWFSVMFLQAILLFLLAIILCILYGLSAWTDVFPQQPRMFASWQAVAVIDFARLAVDLWIAGILLMVIACIAASQKGKAILRSAGLVYMGRYGLGSYMLHPMLAIEGPQGDGPADYLRVADVAIVPGLRQVMLAGFRYLGWVGLCLAMYVYVVVFMLTLGPAFHKVCIVSFEFAEYAWTLVSQRFSQSKWLLQRQFRRYRLRWKNQKRS